ncbi:MAG TPA: hypothetical protein VEG08_13025 [Terriglobales bacterium]|nr:hypothetical protein [Terriglobales bacterium]
MPVTYQIDAGSRLIRTRCTGQVTLQEVVDHFRELEQDPACPDRPRVFLDLSEVDSLPEPVQLGAVIQELERIRPRVRFDACAILATRDALFGMMRMFEAMSESYFRVTRTFRVAGEAEAWLAAQQAPPASRGKTGG